MYVFFFLIFISTGLPLRLFIIIFSTWNKKYLPILAQYVHIFGFSVSYSFYPRLISFSLNFLVFFCLELIRAIQKAFFVANSEAAFVQATDSDKSIESLNCSANCSVTILSWKECLVN